MSNRKRIDELLLLRAIEGLSAAEQQELASLLEDEPIVDVARFDSAAALVMLATLDPREEMPASLAQSLLRRVGASLE